MASTEFESEVESTSGPYYCVPPRCDLCQYKLSPGATVVASVDGQLSSPYRYGDDESAQLGEIQPVFVACPVSCKQYDGLVPGFHVGCAAFASRFPRGDGSLDAAAYAFDPPPGDEAARYNRTRRLLAARLRAEYATLPLEVWLLVADELVRECAVFTAHELWRRRFSADCELDLSRGVWARHLHLDGTRYIEALSNATGPGFVKILAAADPSRAKAPGAALYSVEDHLGIRQLILCGGGEEVRTPRVDRGRLWWRTFPLGSERLQAKSDGLKIRSLALTWNLSAEKANVWWSSPVSPQQRPRIRSWNFDYDSYSPPVPDSVRMVSVPCNRPEVTGYSVCWGSTLQFIHAHRDGDDDLSFYGHSNVQWGAWSYMPIGPDEYIEELWGRRGRCSLHMGFMVKTNKKCVRFGKQETLLLSALNGKTDLKWGYICSLPKHPTELYFNFARDGVHKIAVKQPATSTKRTGPPIVRAPPYPVPTAPSNVQYFYSAASLEGVAEITPCWRRLDTHGAISGLLLRYADGSRGCAGEFRMDCVGETLRVDYRQGLLQLGFARGKGGPHVARLELGPVREAASSSLCWLSLPWRGVLQWWFAGHYGLCQLSHEGQHSPSYFYRLG